MCANHFFIIHHTYFKPSCFRFLSPSQAFNLVPISFEEGIGSYGDLKHYRDVAKREGKKLPLLSLMVKKILSIFVRQRFSVLGPKVKVEHADAFRHAVSLVSDWQVSQDAQIEIAALGLREKNVIIVFMGPYVDMFGVGEKELSAALTDIKKLYAGCELLIKPHPLEVKSLKVYDRMGIPRIHSKISGEELISLVKPKRSIGFYSGALLVSRNVFGVDFDLLGDIGGKYIMTPSDSIAKLFESRSE
ncbi:hypothetical protein D3C77_453050 [compost metagenome]